MVYLDKGLLWKKLYNLLKKLYTTSNAKWEKQNDRNVYYDGKNTSEATIRFEKNHMTSEEAFKKGGIERKM